MTEFQEDACGAPNRAALIRDSALLPIDYIEK
jgi:hypothetical protein